MIAKLKKYLANRRHKKLLSAMKKCVLDEFYAHKLDLNCFWSQFPYMYVNSLKIQALNETNQELLAEIQKLEKLAA